MQSITRAARRRCYLSRHERQRAARAAAFSRRTPTDPAEPPPVDLKPEDLGLIERLVRYDRTPVSSALLAIAGVGAGEATRRAVLASVREAAEGAQAQGTINSARAGHIARHIRAALERLNSSPSGPATLQPRADGAADWRVRARRRSAASAGAGHSEARSPRTGALR